MDEQVYTVEVCTNEEWWRVFGPACEVEDDLIGELIRKVFKAVEKAGGGAVTAIRAQGQRSMCHGWNGANTFERKDKGLGTHHDIPDRIWDRLMEAVDAVVDDFEYRSMILAG